jgi:hypothetical protein
MGKGGGGGQTTTVQKSDPWSGVQQYLVGNQKTQLKPGVQPIYQTTTSGGNGSSSDGYNGLGGLAGIFGNGQNQTTSTQQVNPASDYETVGTPGIYPETAKMYQAGGWSPQMQSLADAENQSIALRTPWQVGQINQLGGALSNGQFDPNVQSVKNISGVPNITAQNVTAQSVDPTQAFSSLGAANPTGSISQLLSGQVNNPYLSQMAQGLQGLSNQNLMQNVMPGIRSGAEAAGQYGGSRQGIAEGVAAGNAQTGLNNAIANLYGNAYQQAQQNMYGTANNMAGLGLSNAQSNANRDLTAQTTNADNSLKAQGLNAANALQTQQFNANLGLQNNAQAMQQSQQQVANRLQGLNSIQAVNSLVDNSYAQQQGLLNAPNDYNWNNLNNYSSIVNNGAKLGGTSSTSTPYYSNPISNALGLGMSGLGLYNGLSGAGLLGGGAAAAGEAAALGSGLTAGASSAGLLGGGSSLLMAL